MISKNNNGRRSKIMMTTLLTVMITFSILTSIAHAEDCAKYDKDLKRVCGWYNNDPGETNSFDEYMNDLVSKNTDTVSKAALKQYKKLKQEEKPKAEAEKEDKFSLFDMDTWGDDDSYGLLFDKSEEDKMEQEYDEWFDKEVVDKEKEIRAKLAKDPDGMNEFKKNFCNNDPECVNEITDEMNEDSNNLNEYIQEYAEAEVEADKEGFLKEYCGDDKNCIKENMKKMEEVEEDCTASAGPGLKCQYVGGDLKFIPDRAKIKSAYGSMAQDFVVGWMERGAFELIKKSAFAKEFTYAGIVEGCIDEYLSGQANVGLGDVDLSGVGQPSSNDMNVGVDYDCDSNWYNYATGDFNCSYSSLLSEGTGLLDAAMEKIMNNMQNIHILGLFNEEVTPNGRQFRYAYAGAISAPESSTWGIFLKNSETKEMETLDQVFVQYSPDNFEIPMMKETFVMQDFFNCICANKTATGQHFCFQLVGRKCGIREIDYYDDVTGEMKARNVTDCNRMEFYNNEGRKSCNG